MKLSEWFKTASIQRGAKHSRTRYASVGPNHIRHPHWKKPAKKSRRLRLRANRWRMQLLSRRRNRDIG